MQRDSQREVPKFIDITSSVLILYSCITVALETMPELSAYKTFFTWSESFVAFFFTIEYLIRWKASNQLIRYPFRPMAVVDLLAIIPFYLGLSIDLRAVRVFRLLRLVRVFKLARYGRALETLSEAVRRVSAELLVATVIALMTIVLSASLLYFAENKTQPEAFRSIPASIWWAIVTLTTVGYGDVYPQTIVGKIIASIIMLIGVGFIAIPTSLLSTSMADVIRERKSQKDHSDSAKQDEN